MSEEVKVYPWRAIVAKKRAAADRAEDRAAELRAQADAIEAEHVSEDLTPERTMPLTSEFSYLENLIERMARVERQLWPEEWTDL